MWVMMFSRYCGLGQLGGALGDLLLQHAIELALLLDQPEVGADLVDQQVVVDRLEQVVHGADGEAALLELLGLEGRGEEDDGDVAGALAQLEHGGGLEAVHLRHLDIEDDEVDVRVLQGDVDGLWPEVASRIATSMCSRSGAQREQVVRVIVDDQQFESGVAIHAVCRSACPSGP
jgi:hypothetical protein